jgi:putative DNA primase/helicase
MPKFISFNNAFKKWFIWDGYRWRDDTTGEIRRLVKRMIAEFLRQAVIAGKSLIEFAYASQDQRDLLRIEASARDYLYIEPNKFDAHPFLLSCLNGTLDLRTRVIRPHSPDDYITKLIHVNYNPRAQCPRFRKFLAEILPSPRLRAWLRRVIGYALTGDTSARAVFVLFGRGNNGKTTLLVVIGKLLSEYSVVINPDTLMNHKYASNNAQAELANLKGARFVRTSECETGSVLSQAKLKALTQGLGAEITACRKYENPFTFRESHKLSIDTNHQSVMRCTA